MLSIRNNLKSACAHIIYLESIYIVSHVCLIVNDFCSETQLKLTMAFPTYIKDEGDMDFGTECPIFPPNCRYKVASVTINGKSITTLLTDDEELLCFPQLVDYFLKDHVAGMPTIYAKVKRMGIIARSCNLDQVRLMRSMGAIGPVVNRCKLITMDDFKRLYEDCLLFRYVKFDCLHLAWFHAWLTGHRYSGRRDRLRVFHVFCVVFRNYKHYKDYRHIE